MGYSFIVSVALVMGFMLSPESLVLLGNFAGIAGIYFLAVILLAVIFHMLTALSYGELFALYPGQEGEACFIRAALGPVPAILFPVCSRIVTALCISTGIIVTAGFVFNEVFLYWFPNFAFAFLLLGFLMMINLLGRGIAEKFQIFFVTLALSGLLFLSAFALIRSGNAPSMLEDIRPAMNLKIGSIGLLLFLGFDLVGFTNEKRGEKGFLLVKSMITGILLAGTVFCLWSLASVIHVPLSKLADTTIPYSVAARRIMGQKGRIIIGCVLISGTCSAVNALFMAVSRMMAGMVKQGLIPRFLGSFKDRIIIPPILLAIGIAVMMATGMAGEPELEVYIRGALLFWLLNYAVAHLCILILRRRIPERSRPFKVPGYPMTPILGFIVVLTGFVGLLWIEGNTAQLIKFMMIVFGAILFYSLIWIRLARKKGWIHPK